MSRVSEFLERLSGARAFVLALFVIGAWHADVVQDPPYWDGLTGAFAQAHWLATRSFSPLALLRDATTNPAGGACVYPFSIYPWIIALFESGGVTGKITYFCLHVLSFAAAAWIVAAVFVLVRKGAGSGLAALVALALLVQPMFRALACQMNMDILLAACTLAALFALSERRYSAATVWAALALLVKPTGIILVAAQVALLALRWWRPDLFQLDERERRLARRALAWNLGLFALFVVELVVIAHFGQSPPGVSLFGGTVQFLGKRLWTLPEFGLALLAFGALAPWIAWRAIRGRASGLELDMAVFLVAFVGFYCQYKNVLPRYYLQAWPVVLTSLVLAGLALRIPRRAVGGALVLFAVFGFANAHGRFHPTKWADWSVPNDPRPLVSNEGWLLERSLEYRDDLALNQKIAARLDGRTEWIVVANWPLLQLLAVPELGYVRTPPRLASGETPIDFAATKIDYFKDIPTGAPVVWAITPNVYCGPYSSVMEGDQVLETFEHGRLRAFLLNRPRAPDAERR